jgi:hypothetical protein
VIGQMKILKDTSLFNGHLIDISMICRIIRRGEIIVGKE